MSIHDSATAIEDAQRRARKLYPRSKGFRGAYLKGARAALRGAPESACPYPDDPAKTWRQAWRLAWMRGYLSIAPPASEG